MMMDMYFVFSFILSSSSSSFAVAVCRCHAKRHGSYQSLGQTKRITKNVNFFSVWKTAKTKNQLNGLRGQRGGLSWIQKTPNWFKTNAFRPHQCESICITIPRLLFLILYVYAPIYLSTGRTSAGRLSLSSVHTCITVCVREWVKKKTVRLFFLCQFHNISNTWCNKNQTPCTSIQRKWQSVPNNNSNQNSNVRNFCLLLAHKMLSINYLVDFSSFSSSSSLFLIDVYPI